MTLSEKCKLWIKSGLLYETGETSPISDETFDTLSRQLLKNYSKLPKWFSSKISEIELSCGTASEVTGKFSPSNS